MGDAAFFLTYEKYSSGMQSQPAYTQRSHFEPVKHAMVLGQLIKRHGDQMGHYHQGDEEESEVHLHVGFQMEAKDTADEDHGDLADDHREFPPVETKRREK